ncbi:hypothetical protein DUNSADRAFT_8558 [Dunaliella salina]|uniref:protein-tyrosine-phosphatase n=1 Tax=Dunaliella salina TaxID=3046 RepID=A0ABQ7GJ84_DUNSA|nr:hypothetical protein DUNSADRAFT_8558 [Dunaliella salina]|eukprot:KAF5834676.1 hypothetical protein DUNSADRAFT_8558 [Dunaliella salina]
MGMLAAKTNWKTLQAVSAKKLQGLAVPKRSRAMAAPGGEVHTYTGFNELHYNFGVASDLDQVVHGAARPGANAEDGQPTDAQLDDWVNYMKSKGISRVVGLLSGKEISTYKEPPVESLKKRGMKAMNLDLDTMEKLEASNAAVQEFEDAAKSGEKVVVHCWGGSGRTGSILAAWLCRKYGLSPEEACNATCSVPGTARSIAPKKVEPMLPPK